MKTAFVAGSLALSMMMLAGLASADGAGVCVFGVGGNFQPNAGTGVYAGVNVASPVIDPTGAIGFGQGSETGVYMTAAEYEEQCCAETGQAPDCFAPVG